MDEILKVENLVKHHRQGLELIKAVDGISFKVDKGEFISIVGKSGSGKTTLLHLIGGLEKSTSGEVIISENQMSSLDEEDLSQFRRKNIGFIFQNYNLLPILNVMDNIMLPLGLGGEKVDIEFFSEVISILQIEDKLRSMPNQLSGGEQQRVAIARALITKPSIILADEPTGNLDSRTSESVVELLKKTGKEFKQTLLMVTHNENIAKQAERMICLNKGRIASFK